MLILDVYRLYIFFVMNFFNLQGHLRDGNFFDNGDPSYSMADFPVDNSSVCAKNTVNVLSSNFIYQKPVLMQVSPVTAITEDFSPSAPNKTGNAHTYCLMFFPTNICIFICMCYLLASYVFICFVNEVHYGFYGCSITALPS